MRKMKVLLAVILATVMMLTVFTGCSKNTGEEDTTSSVAQSEDTRVELGDTVDGEYTVIEIDEANVTYTAVKLDEPDSYRLHTYTEGRVYNLETNQQIQSVTYERDADNNPVKITYTDIETDAVVATEEYTYNEDGKLLTFTKRNEKGISTEGAAYTYNEDGTYKVDTTKTGRIVKSEEYDKNGNITRFNEYKYADDGSYSVKSFEDDKLVKVVSFAADGTENERHEYSYDDDGSFKEGIYQGDELLEEVTHASEEAETRAPEASTAAEKATLAADAKIEKSTTSSSENTTKKNETTTTKKSDSSADVSVSQEVPTLPERKETSSDLLKESRIYRSGNFYLAGTMSDTEEVGQFELALTDNTTYASAQMNLSDLGLDGAGVADMAVLSTTDNKYYILEGVSKTYCEMDESVMSMLGVDDPEEMFAELDFKSTMLNIPADADPTKTETTTLNGAAVTCYTFTAEDGNLSKHYVNKDGQLIRIEDCSSTGSVITTVDISFISADVPANRKDLPSDYTKQDFMTFMMNMLAGALGDE